MILKICDNDGFLAIFNSEKYNSFLKDGWEYQHIIDHFIKEMNSNTFLIWRTGFEGGDYNVEFKTEKSNKISVREFEARIKITNAKIHLTDYSALTMAASYPNIIFPPNHHSQLFHNIADGNYLVTIRQLFEPDTFDYQENDVQFEIILSPSENNEVNSFANITWNQ